MAEMTLIKMGEILDKPQHKRKQMIERAAEEQRAAAESREREAQLNAKEVWSTAPQPLFVNHSAQPLFVNHSAQPLFARV